MGNNRWKKIAKLCLAFLFWIEKEYVVGQSGGETEQSKFLDYTGYPQTNCQLVHTRPNPEARRYTLESCITIEFAGYIYADIFNYFGFGYGQVDLRKSWCYNGSYESQILINYDCGSLKLTVKKHNVKPQGHNLVTLEGSFQVNDKQNTFVHYPIEFSNETKCLYYSSKMVELVKLGLENDLVLANLTYEIHRSDLSHGLNGCSHSYWYILYLIIVLIFVFVFIGFAIISKRFCLDDPTRAHRFSQIYQ